MTWWLHRCVGRRWNDHCWWREQSLIVRWGWRRLGRWSLFARVSSWTEKYYFYLCPIKQSFCPEQGFPDLIKWSLEAVENTMTFYSDCLSSIAICLCKAMLFSIEGKVNETRARFNSAYHARFQQFSQNNTFRSHLSTCFHMTHSYRSWLGECVVVRYLDV